MTTVPDVGPTPDDELSRLIARTSGLQPWRRVFHAVNGVLLAFVPAWLGLESGTTVAVLSGMLVVQLGLDLARFRSPVVQKLFFRWANPLASPREAEGIASSTWYTVGAILAYALFPMGIASPAVLVLGLADPAAGTIGRLFGRTRFGKGSVEGSAAFFVTAVTVLLLFVDLRVALVAAAAATLVEIVPGLGDDNLTIPVATGGVLWLLLAGPIFP